MSRARIGSGIVTALVGVVVLCWAARTAWAENSPHCNTSLEVEPLPGVANPSPTEADDWRPKGGDPLAVAPWTCVTVSCAKPCKVAAGARGMGQYLVKCACPDTNPTEPGDQGETSAQFCSIAVSFTMTDLGGGIIFIGNVHCICLPSASCLAGTSCKFSATPVNQGGVLKYYADCNCQ